MFDIYTVSVVSEVMSGNENIVADQKRNYVGQWCPNFCVYLRIFGRKRQALYQDEKALYFNAGILYRNVLRNMPEFGLGRARFPGQIAWNRQIPAPREFRPDCLPAVHENAHT